MSNGSHSQQRFSLLQIILDEPIILLFLGIAIFVIFYLTWGLIEISNVPPLPPELKSFTTTGR